MKRADLYQGFERIEKKQRTLTPNPWLDVEFNKTTPFGREPGFLVDDIPERLGLLHEDSPVSLSGKELLDGSVTSVKLFDGSVLNSKLRDACVSASKIADEAIIEAKIAAESITEEKIAADSVTATKINVVGLDGATGRIVVVDQTDADEITAGINSHAVTLIQPGKVLISGVVNLDDWRSGVDATYIDGGKIYAQSITATQILAGTITADEIHAGTITADNLAAGLKMYWYSGVSTTARNDNAAEQTSSSNTYEKIKEMKINEITGAMNVRFGLLATEGVPKVAYGKIYKNGSPIGVERSTSNTVTWQYFEEAIAACAVDDLIQIYAKKAGISEIARVKDMALRYDRGVSIVCGETLTTPLPTVDQTIFSVTNQDP